MFKIKGTQYLLFSLFKCLLFHKLLGQYSWEGGAVGGGGKLHSSLLILIFFQMQMSVRLNLVSMPNPVRI